MKFTLEIRMANSEGALERILGRLRQRAFSLCSISADRSADQSIMEARITVESSRPIDNVIRQLDKLFDVISIRLYESTYTETYESPARLAAFAASE